ncbi:MAG: stage III sporulation protein AA [Bacillota bacterium]
MAGLPNAQTATITREGWDILASCILPILPEHLRALLSGLPPHTYATLEEIRLSVGAPLFLTVGSGDYLVSPEGRLVKTPEEAYHVTKGDVAQAFELVTGSSVYAWEEEIASGFLTLPGGHRVGIAGTAVLERGAVKTLKYISGLNLRLGREVKGAADVVLRHILNAGAISNTLVVSPPRCGKTTLLRDVVRQVSHGVPSLGLRGLRVGLVDERSEIASSYQGQPQKDVGPRTDVLDRCPKAAGIMMLIRSMSPEVVATDEIGSPRDAEAIEEALSAGVRILASAHASGVEDIAARPGLKPVVATGAFDRFLVLSRNTGPGTLEEVIDGNLRCLWRRRPERVMSR